MKLEHMSNIAGVYPNTFAQLTIIFSSLTDYEYFCLCSVTRELLDNMNATEVTIKGEGIDTAFGLASKLAVYNKNNKKFSCFTKIAASDNGITLTLNPKVKVRQIACILCGQMSAFLVGAAQDEHIKHGKG